MLDFVVRILCVYYVLTGMLCGRGQSGRGQGGLGQSGRGLYDFVKAWFCCVEYAYAGGTCWSLFCMRVHM